MKSSWKISTASPKRSWSGVRTTSSSLRPESSGGVKSGTPTRHGYERPRCEIWNESQSMSRTVALRETTTLPWFTSPITWPCWWTASNAAARLRAVRTRKPQVASGNAVLRSAGP